MKKIQFSHKPKSDYKNKNNGDRYRNFCKIIGHTRDVCFKLNGYPYWYEDLKEKNKKNFNSTHMVNTSPQYNNHSFDTNESVPSSQYNNESMNALLNNSTSL